MGLNFFPDDYFKIGAHFIELSMKIIFPKNVLFLVYNFFAFSVVTSKDNSI